MADQALNPTVFQEAMQQITLLIYNRQPPWSPSDFSFIRVDWQTQGQPNQAVDVDAIYLRSVEEDDPFNRTRDVSTEPSDMGDPKQVQQVTTYTRVWRTYWCLYGPNSFDNARKLRSGLFLPAIHDYLASNFNLYLVTDIAAPRRVPEYFVGQWWERVDFDARFNEPVVERPAVPSVASAEIILENADGILADITVNSGN